MILTLEQLAAAVPNASAHAWLDPINLAIDEFAIDDPRDVAAFLATCAHESADFTRLVENLNYSADGLANIWPMRYSTGMRTRAGRYIPNALATTLARRPEAIANNAYANRLGNGNEASGDGWRFRGRGIIQLTGRANYAAASFVLGADFVATPALVELPLNAARTAGWWWAANRASRYAGDMLAVSKLVNLGDARAAALPLGWNERSERYTLALASIGGQA
jgi:putative chitinase